MEAKREVLEFRSGRRLEAGEFLARVNKSLPPGIKFSSLEEVGPASPSLHNAMERLVYSLDWKTVALGRAWSAGDLKLALGRFKESPSSSSALDFRLAGRRLFLLLPPLPARGLRAQDIVRAVFGIEDPVFLIRRDDIVLEIDRTA
jgi:hypothetical protein